MRSLFQPVFSGRHAQNLRMARKQSSLPVCCRFTCSLPETVVAQKTGAPVMFLFGKEGAGKAHALTPDRTGVPCSWQMVVRVGFEPTYATRADLQSAAFNHSATSPDCLFA